MCSWHGLTALTKRGKRAFVTVKQFNMGEGVEAPSIINIEIWGMISVWCLYFLGQ